MLEIYEDVSQIQKMLEDQNISDSMIFSDERITTLEALVSKNSELFTHTHTQRYLSVTQLCNARNEDDDSFCQFFHSFE